MSETPNAQQVAYWNDQAGPTWADLQAPLDRQLAPLGRRVMAELDLGPGRRVLDVGCGAGETTLALAATGAEAVGVDISRPLLEVARARSQGIANVSFLEADAQAQGFPEPFDAIFSRFGVMFFADPVAAFTNLHGALKPGGRLAFVCWRRPDENPVMTAPMRAALAHIDAPPAPPADPTAPGPFAFADPERLLAILSAAGFAEVAVTPHDEKIGGNDLDTTLGLSLKVGPLGALLRENPDKREAVIGAVRDLLSQHLTPDGVKLGSATWIVTARA